MTYFNDMENYIAGLCTKHKLLLHTNGGTAFIPMGIADEGSPIVSNIKKTYVKVMDVSVSKKNEQLVWMVVVRFLQNMGNTTPRTETINEASQNTQQIMMDFEARINEMVFTECSFINRLLDPTFEPVGLTDQNAIGWDYAWRFTTDKIDYNANAWEE